MKKLKHESVYKQQECPIAEQVIGALFSIPSSNQSKKFEMNATAGLNGSVVIPPNLPFIELTIKNGDVLTIIKLDEGSQITLKADGLEVVFQITSLKVNK